MVHTGDTCNPCGQATIDVRLRIVALNDVDCLPSNQTYCVRDCCSPSHNVPNASCREDMSLRSRLLDLTYKWAVRKQYDLGGKARPVKTLQDVKQDNFKATSLSRCCHMEDPNHRFV